MSEINKIARNFLSVSFSNMLSQILVFLIVAYTARILGKEGFGAVSLAQAVITYFSVLAVFGLNTFGVREIARGKENRSRVLDEIISVRVLLSFATLILLVTVVFLLQKEVSFKILVILYALTLFPIAVNLDWYFSGIQEMQHNAVFNVIRNAIPLLLLVFFLKAPNQLYYVPLFVFGGSIAGLAYQYFIIWRKGIQIQYKIKKDVLGRYLKAGFPFFLSGLLLMLNTNVDRLVIGFYRSESELGIYAAAYNVILFLTNLTAVIFVSVFPLLIEYYHSNKKDELKELADGVAKAVVLFSLPVAVGGIILAKEIAVFLYGPSFADAYKPLIILLVFSILMFVRQIYGYQLNAWNREKAYLKIMALSAGVNVGLNIMLTPLLGILWAASVNIVSETIMLFLMRKKAAEAVKTNVLKYFFEGLVPASLMGLFIWFTRARVFLLADIFLAIVIYFGLLLLLRIITLNEIKRFMAKKKTL